MSQEGKEFRNFKKWTNIQLLKHHKIIDQNFKLVPSNFKLFMEHLASLYSLLLEKNKAEKKRFKDIELRVNKIIYDRQLKGVRVNVKLAEKKCRQIEKEIYNIKNKLQFEYGIYTPDNKLFQQHYLKEKEYKVVQSFRYTFKTRRGTDPISGLLYELIRSSQDLDSLLYTISHFGGKNRTHPWYLGFGTITSRIILRQPSLQNLRRVNRDIIIPDNGMKLLYVDFSQFEAGILASLSKDKKLIELYKTDIYTDIAEKIFADKEKRADAKVLFYRYIYGDETLGSNVKAYFKQFGALDTFKDKINEEINEKGKIGTTAANYRSRFEDEECSWSLSHKIQSTASLIYKNAIISVYDKVEHSEFLIPMHDATLYQIPDFQYEDFKNRIIAIYKEEFKKICPQIDVRVSTNEKF